MGLVVLEVPSFADHEGVKNGLSVRNVLFLDWMFDGARHVWVYVVVLAGPGVTGVPRRTYL